MSVKDCRKNELYAVDQRYVDVGIYTTTSGIPDYEMQPMRAIGDILECEYCGRRNHFTPDNETCKGCGAPI